MYACHTDAVQSRSVGTLSILTGLKGQADAARCCPDGMPQIIYLACRTGASKKASRDNKNTEVELKC